MPDLAAATWTILSLVGDEVRLAFERSRIGAAVAHERRRLARAIVAHGLGVPEENGALVVRAHVRVVEDGAPETADDAAALVLEVCRDEIDDDAALALGRGAGLTRAVAGGASPSPARTPSPRAGRSSRRTDGRRAGGRSAARRE